MTGPGLALWCSKVAAPPLVVLLSVSWRGWLEAFESLDSFATWSVMPDETRYCVNVFVLLIWYGAGLFVGWLMLVGSLLPTPPLVSSSLGWTGMLVWLCGFGVMR